MNPHHITKALEASLCDYTGSPYAVAVNSCTMALELSLLWLRFSGGLPKGAAIDVPKNTYPSVPQSVIRAGFEPFYVDLQWKGAYPLYPTKIWDSAKRFTSGMYRSDEFQCVSFHVAKIFGDTQGGAILHSDPNADEFFRLARFDGRRPMTLRHDKITLPASFTRHCYMSPDVAARLLNHMQYLPRENEDQEEEYADISYIR